MLNQIKKFFADEAGLTIVEYAIAGGVIAALAAGAFLTLGGNVSDRIEELNTQVVGN